MTRLGGASRYALRLLLAALFIGAVALFFVLGGHEYLTFAALKEGRDQLTGFTQRHFVLALSASVLAFTAATAFSLPVATLLSLAVGLMFGRWLGTGVIVLSGTLGATLLLIAARYVFRDVLQRRVRGQLERFDRAFRRSAFLYVAFLRVIPVFPFWLINLAAAGTSVGVSTYAAATALGMIPISFVWASLGESLGRIESPADALSGTTIAALTVLGLVGLTAVVLKNRIFREPDGKSAADTTDARTR